MVELYFHIALACWRFLFGVSGRASAASAPPADVTITTLWLGGLDESVTEEELREKFYQYGAIGSVRMVPGKGCAFLTFTSRKAAEDASAACKGSLMLRGMRVRVDWGKSSDSNCTGRSTDTTTYPV
jgi:RNA recognition motif-containing protein